MQVKTQIQIQIEMQIQIQFEIQIEIQIKVPVGSMCSSHYSRGVSGEEDGLRAFPRPGRKTPTRT